MKNDSDAEAKVVLRRVVEARWIVICLKGSDAQAIGCLDVQTAAERCRQTCFRRVETLASGYRRGAERRAEIR